MENKNIIEVKNLVKNYGKGRNKTTVLNNISFELLSKESLLIIGPSGSGKTTLLHILGGLDNPSLGKVYIEEELVNGFSDEKLSSFRNQKIGFVFQFFHLQDYLTAKENICLPLKIAGKNDKYIKGRAEELLDLVGLKRRADYYPNEMSGGEMQRVAIARALANKPKLILADEPTGNLDKENAIKVIDIFNKISKTGVSVILVTHDESIGRNFKNILEIDKGEVVGQK